jgi:hypothetical protein
MRRSVLCCLALVLTTAACKREPSFDERYAGASKAIAQKAHELDTEMARRATEASEAAVEPSGAPRS